MQQCVAQVTNNFMPNEAMHKVKGEKMGGDCMPMKKETRILPTFRLTDEDLPEIADCEVGEKYTLVMEVEQIAVRQGDEWQGADNKDKRMHATFKIISVGIEEPVEPTYEQEYATKRSAAAKKDD